MLEIISWNINGVKTKLEKRKVQDLLLDFDVMRLNEKKTTYSSLPRVCRPQKCRARVITPWWSRCVQQGLVG